MIRIVLLRLGAVAAALALMACTPAPVEDAPRTEARQQFERQLIATFRTAVFVPEGAPSDGSLRADGTVPLFKWTDAIRWGFDLPPADPGDEDALRRFAEGVSRGVDLPTLHSTNPLDGGSRFLVLSRDRMARFPFGGGQACIGSLGTLQDGPNTGAPVTVGIVDEALPPDRRRQCLADLFVKSMGLSGAQLLGAPVVQGGAAPELAPLGALLLTILYDPRLKPGMTEDKAMPIVRAIVAEFDING